MRTMAHGRTVGADVGGPMPRLYEFTRGVKDKTQELETHSCAIPAATSEIQNHRMA